jgi:hypothetical protein
MEQMGCLTRVLKLTAIAKIPTSPEVRIENCAGGFQYQVGITISGPIDPRSGLIFERDRLDRILQLSIIKPLHGCVLSENFPDISAKGLARSLFLRLNPLFPEGMLTRVSIQEGTKDHFFFPEVDEGEAGDTAAGDTAG